MAEDKSIEEIFRSSFANEELSPPSSFQNQLFNALDEHKVEDVYREAFEEEEIKPRPVVWSRISRALWLTSFLSFQYNRLNIYYVASIMGIAGFLTLNLLSEETKTEVDAVAVALESPVVESIDVADPEIVDVQEASIIESTPALDVQGMVEETSTVRSTVSIPQSKTEDTGTVVNESLTPETVFTVIADSKACVGQKVAVSVSPELSGYTIVANDSKGNVEKNTVSFTEPGEYSVTVLDASNVEIGQKRITVVEGKPVAIKGDNTLCQFKTNQTFTASSDKDLGIQYVWSLVKNKHKIRGNGFVEIEASVAGKDTVTLTTINNNTGCVTKSVMPIQIVQAPSAEFTVVEQGNLLVEIKTKKTRNQSSRWYLNGEEIDLDDQFYQFEESGDYRLKHVLTGKNKCVDSAQVDININNYSLFVPNGIIAGENTFKPVGTGLQDYKIEIFDVNNVKLWESTALTNGVPTDGWNGYARGKLQSAGKYYYKIHAEFANGAVWKGIESNGKYSTTGVFDLIVQ